MQVKPQLVEIPGFVVIVEEIAIRSLGQDVWHTMTD